MAGTHSNGFDTSAFRIDRTPVCCSSNLPASVSTPQATVYPSSSAVDTSSQILTLQIYVKQLTLRPRPCRRVRAPR